MHPTWKILYSYILCIFSLDLVFKRTRLIRLGWLMKRYRKWRPEKFRLVKNQFFFFGRKVFSIFWMFMNDSLWTVIIFFQHILPLFANVGCWRFGTRCSRNERSSARHLSRFVSYSPSADKGESVSERLWNTERFVSKHTQETWAKFYTENGYIYNIYCDKISTYFRKQKRIK